MLEALSGSAAVSGKGPQDWSLVDSQLSSLLQKNLTTESILFECHFATVSNLDQQPQSKMDFHTSIQIDREHVITQLQTNECLYQI